MGAYGIATKMCRLINFNERNDNPPTKCVRTVTFGCFQIYGLRILKLTNLLSLAKRARYKERPLSSTKRYKSGNEDFRRVTL